MYFHRFGLVPGFFFEYFGFANTCFSFGVVCDRVSILDVGFGWLLSGREHGVVQFRVV